MNSQDLAAQLELYDQLRAQGRHEDAARVGEGLLWHLDQAHREVELQRIVADLTDGTSTHGPNLWLTIGDIFYSRNSTDRARAAYLHGLQPPSAPPHIHVRLLHGIGNTYYVEGDYLRAKDYYEASLAMSRDAMIRDGEAESLLQLSDTYRVLGDFDRALSAGQDSLDINLQEGRKSGVSRSVQSLCNLASYLDATGRRPDAEALLDSCSHSLRTYADKSALDMIRHTAMQLAFTPVS